MSRNSPEALARWCRDECGLEEVEEIDLAALAQQRGVRIQRADLDGILGAAMVVEGISGILIKRQRYRPRYRFTLAHELGHLFLPRHYSYLAEGHLLSDRYINPATERDDREQEANQFAAELLAPRGMVRSHLRAGSYDLNTAKAIANAFGISLTAAALRMVDSSPQQIAVLKFEGSCLRWRYDGRDFPFGVPWRDWEAPPGSATADVIEGKGNVPESVDTTPQIWFVERDRGRYPPHLVESCIKLGSTGSYLTMLWAPS